MGVAETALYLHVYACYIYIPCVKSGILFSPDSSFTVVSHMHNTHFFGKDIWMYLSAGFTIE